MCSLLALWITHGFKITQMKFHKKLSAISLGQGQGPRAEAMMRQAMDRGRWVFFQNCHLSPSWMPTLERLIEQIDGDKVRPKFSEEPCLERGQPILNCVTPIILYLQLL